MHAAVHDTVGKLCFPTLFFIECLIKMLNCYACSSVEISSNIVLVHLRWLPDITCLMMNTDWGNNCKLTFTDWKCKELSSQELQTSKMLCVIHRMGAPPLHHKTSHYACSSAWCGWKVMLPFFFFSTECLTKQLNCFACNSGELSSIIVTDSSTLTPRYFLLNNAHRLRDQLHA